MSAAAPAAASARRSSAPRRHGGQRHQLGASGSTSDRLLLEEARGMLADGVCDVPLQQASPALKCSVGTPNWSPATTACTDASYMVPLELPAATVDLEDSQWPSVHEADRQLAAERGWDFVSEASDEDGSWVEELDARLAPESPEAGGPPGELGEGGAGSAVWLVTSSAPPPPE
ncbi:unnamed protein product, partial [Prorocentrum cordatum]